MTVEYLMNFWSSLSKPAANRGREHASPNFRFSQIFCIWAFTLKFGTLVEEKISSKAKLTAWISDLFSIFHRFSKFAGSTDVNANRALGKDFRSFWVVFNSFGFGNVIIDLEGEFGSGEAWFHDSEVNGADGRPSVRQTRYRCKGRIL